MKETFLIFRSEYFKILLYGIKKYEYRMMSVGELQETEEFKRFNVNDNLES